MRAVLEARRKAAMVRVEELEAELQRVRADLADVEPAPCGAASGERGRGRRPVARLPGGDGRRGGGRRRRAGRPAGGRGVGWDSASASCVEGARARLKRLVERGWLVETKPGRFTLPTGQ